MADRLSRLGELLLDGKLINQTQLSIALKTQQDVGGRLGQILVRLHYITEDRLAAALSDQLKLPLLGLKDLVVSPAASALLDLEFVEKHHVLAVRRTAETVLVATAEPLDYDALSEVHFHTGLRTEVGVAARSHIQKAIDYYFHGRVCRELEEAEAALRPHPTPSEPAGKSGGFSAAPPAVLQALVELLIEKKVVTQNELAAKLAKRAK